MGGSGVLRIARIWLFAWTIRANRYNKQRLACVYNRQETIGTPQAKSHAIEEEMNPVVRRLLGALAALATLGGCVTVGPDFQTPEADVAEAWQ